YMRGFWWTGRDVTVSPTAVATEFDPPLPLPADTEFTPTVMRTLVKHRSLFKIITPINADALEWLLEEHPNQVFVRSVLCVLR
ncbi:hypothetical protein GGX14DRAFT_313339, partial [Mycena pura]